MAEIRNARCINCIETVSKRGSKTWSIDPTESCSVSSSVQSEVLQGRIKFKFTRLAAKQEEANLVEISESLHGELLERA